MDYNYDPNNRPGSQNAGPTPTPGQTPYSAAPGQTPYTSWNQYPVGSYPSYRYEPPQYEPQFEARPAQPQEPAAGAGPEGAPHQQKKPFPAGRFLTGVALVAACAVAGFGGGYAAISTAGAGNDGTVVYKAAQVDGTKSSGVNKTDGLTATEIADIAGKSVVSITTENIEQDFYTGGRVVSGAGSGVIISADGTIITNNHVIAGAQNIKVALHDGTEYTATLVGTDAATDIAVLKIEATGLTPAVVGDSDNLAVGEFCMAIGNPMGTLGGTVTDGMISALDRQITIDNYTMNLLQMSAAVSPGNSGGGLFNERAELVGIVNAKSSGEGAEGLGFAVPVNTAMSVAEDIIDHGYVTGRPALGVTVVTFASAEEAQMQGVSQPGVYVNSVSAGSAAEKAGLQAGDRIVKADGTEVATQADLSEVLKAHQVGDTIQITIERDGNAQDVSVTLQELNG